MIKSIIFSGGIHDYSWNKTVSESSSEKFNRWMKDHQNIEIIDIKYVGNTDSPIICLLYKEDKNFKEHPSTFEEGEYYVDTITGKLIFLQRNIDVSYMVKNFDLLWSIMVKGECKCVVTAFNGYFKRYYDTSYQVPQSDGGPKTVHNRCCNEVYISDVIKSEFIPMYDVINNNEKFSLKYNTGIYIINIGNRELFKKDNNLDLSYIVQDFYSFSRNLSINNYADNFEIEFSGHVFSRKEDGKEFYMDAYEAIREEYL